MLWEEILAKDFDACVGKSEGLCILPIGVLEKHGDHLPIGTDMFTATAVAKAATEISPAVIFPYYFLGQISEARHMKGTIAASHKLMMEALLEMCDEIHRNGFTKILLLNSHGGNFHFLPFFAQMFPGLNRPYALYATGISSISKEQYQEIVALTGVEDMGQHAGFAETALIMHIRPDLVNMENVNIEESKDMGRLNDIENIGVYTGFNWYAKYPHHFAGDPTKATAEYGKFLFDLASNRVAEVIRKIKADDQSHLLIEEFNKLAN